MDLSDSRVVSRLIIKHLSFRVDHDRFRLRTRRGQIGGGSQQRLQLLNPVHAVHGPVGEDVVHHGHGLGQGHWPRPRGHAGGVGGSWGQLTHTWG